MFDRESALVNAVRTLRANERVGIGDDQRDRNIKTARVWVSIAEAMRDRPAIDA